MKWIRKIIIGLLVIILINLISVFALSLNLKRMLMDGVIKEVIVMKMTNNEQSSENTTITQEDIAQITDDERVRELLNSKEVEDLMNKYLDLTVDGMIDEQALENIDIEKDIIEFMHNNKEDIEKIAGKEISDEEMAQMEEELSSKDLSNAYKQTVQNTQKSLPEQATKGLAGYKIFISQTFRMIVLALIALDLLLIALLQWSWHQWIKKLASSMLVSGILLTIMSVATKMIVVKLANITSFNINSLLITGVSIAVFGLGLLILYMAIIKINEKRKQNEIPEPLTE